MPCLFRLEHHRRAHPGCQFPHYELVELSSGHTWCRFHLPMESGKVRWGEQEIEVFNNAIFAFIDSPVAEGRDVDLSGVVFPGTISFERYKVADRLPNIMFMGANFIGDATFREAEFGGEAMFDKARFFRNVMFGRVSFGGAATFLSALFDGEAKFDGASFGGAATFLSALFEGEAKFDGASFGGEATFQGAQFGRDAKSPGDTTFLGALFSGGATFDEASFGGTTIFNEAIFGNLATFRRASFGGDARFEEASFGGDARFEDASFGNLATFRRANFGGLATFAFTSFGRASFQAARFGEDAMFRGAGFQGSSSFQGARFGGIANFSSAGDGTASATFPAVNFVDAKFFGQVHFYNREFLGSTDFRRAYFERAPEFHGCTLHQGTLFPTAANFRDPGGAVAALAYRTLKYAMASVHARGEEAKFYALEQKSLLRDDDTPLSTKFFSGLYWLAADYGQSVLRPLFGILITIAGFFAIYVAFLLIYLDPTSTFIFPAIHFWDLLGFLLRQVFRPFEVFSLRGAVRAEAVHEVLLVPPLSLALLAALQSVLTLSFLGLLLLALRRRFKLD